MRLIDADLLIERIGFYNTSQEREENVGQIITLEDFDNMPTAYDVDNVVKELEENASRYTKKYLTPYGNNGYRDTKAISIHKAIEIVKQSGVSNDVCEWESVSDGEFIQNPHTKRLYSNEPSMQNVYCNTCGKKIKVVN